MRTRLKMKLVHAHSRLLNYLVYTVLLTKPCENVNEWFGYVKGWISLTLWAAASSSRKCLLRMSCLLVVSFIFLYELVVKSRHASVSGTQFYFSDIYMKMLLWFLKRRNIFIASDFISKPTCISSLKQLIWNNMFDFFFHPGINRRTAIFDMKQDIIVACKLLFHLPCKKFLYR